MADSAVVLEILGIENGGPGFERGGDDEAVVKAVLGFPLDLQGFLVDLPARHDSAMRQQEVLQVVVEKLVIQRDGKPMPCHGAKLLNHLPTDLPRLFLLGESQRDGAFFQRFPIKGVNEDIRIEKVFSVHSFRLG